MSVEQSKESRVSPVKVENAWSKPLIHMNTRSARQVENSKGRARLSTDSSTSKAKATHGTFVEKVLVKPAIVEPTKSLDAPSAPWNASKEHHRYMKNQKKVEISRQNQRSMSVDEAIVAEATLRIPGAKIRSSTLVDAMDFVDDVPVKWSPRTNRSTSFALSSSYSPEETTTERKLARDLALEEDRNFDSDEAWSNDSTDTTTICSYNSSPRSSGPKSPSGNQLYIEAMMPDLSLNEMEEIGPCIPPLDWRTAATLMCPSLLSNVEVNDARLSELAEEIRVQQENTEVNALMRSVQHAASVGVLTEPMEQSLYKVIEGGDVDEVRDVLYHKCHLIPAVLNLRTQIEPDSEHLLRTTQRLVNFLDLKCPVDSISSRNHKFRVLQALSTLVVVWVKNVGVKRGLSPEHIAITSGTLFVAGSYRMGINDPSSDIDTVAVAPWHVSQDDFFGSFVEMLRACPEVRSLAPVTNAFVPLVTLVYDNVAIDILFARLPLSSVLTTQDIDSDYILSGVDAASMKSLNAPRVSTLVLCLVPRRSVFRTVLRAVRFWARSRGIYSSKLGYLGGVSWAILVAFVCQIYPTDDCGTVLTRFFQVISEWSWPQPVVLNVLYDAELGFESWDPRSNIYDRTHIMPIITPAYPPMNSAVQVSHSTFTIMYEELWRARYIAENATGSDSNDESWQALFQPTNFFIRYNTYLALTYSAATVEHMCVWSKFVQSRIRKLVDSLQLIPMIARAHALPKYFPHSGSEKSDTQSIYQCVFIGIEFQPIQGSALKNISDDPQIASSIDQTIRFFEATEMQQFGLRAVGMTAFTDLMSWESLPSFVFENGREVALRERIQFHEEKPAYQIPPRSSFAYNPSQFGLAKTRCKGKRSKKKTNSGKW
ncbi:hypothetical protein Ae201684P_020729 [Aphanomyces euteiches]|uniref:polynucleotide adenylyltransferase n=1 Tax=Aphanomyces euteiches TaxID=100861 RepID=A0A6G0WWW1_9STRA|nr:hypothetical protein Ae201684_010935 [Aphanomyces euteiches]KAH9061393.1 hypothetical protein Ae201684P_020729 [Aphanomyces euteiches]